MGPGRLLLTAVVAVCAACGGSGSAPSGVLEVAGARTFLHCAGKGHPVVILNSGANGDHRQWAGILPRIARDTEVCSWDRPGLGQSPAPYGTVSADALVSRLHGLLDEAGVDPPYIVTGHSLGGFLALLYALRYRSDVSRLVLVDATPPGVVQPFGLGILPDGTHAVDLRPAARELLGVGPAPAGSIVLERGVEPFVPYAARLWRQGQAGLASAGRSLLITATRSDHEIPREQPALVAAAVQEAVSATRHKRPLRCSPALARAGGVCRAGREA